MMKTPRREALKAPLKKYPATHRLISLAIDVTVPITVGEAEVEQALNAAFDEPPCDWGTWIVGGFVITSVSKMRIGD